LVRRHGTGRRVHRARPTAIAELPRSQFVDGRFELLISILHLLDLTGQLTDFILQPIDSDQKLSLPDLCEQATWERHDTDGCDGGKSNTV